MKTTMLTLLAVLTFGCREFVEIDTTPPASPRNISALALDNEVQLEWMRNTENDLAGYNVWSSNRYDGRYELLGTTTSTTFSDLRARNGNTYFYAVSAFDHSENESDLSYQEVFGTPRPEGFNVPLFETSSVPEKAGYDFSSYTVGRFDDRFTDVFYERKNEASYLSVWSDTDVQDMGYTTSFDEIRAAPSTGWSPSRRAEVIAGHTYVVWTWDNHFAKVRISKTSSTGIVFDWSYQLAEGNRSLKSSLPGGERKALTR